MLRIFPLLLALLATASAPFALAEDAAPSNFFQKKLQRIIVPRLEFRDASAAEALQFLARKSVQLDTTTGEFKPPAKIDPQGLPDVRLTVSLSNVSLYQALHHVAAIAGVRLIYTADSFRVEAFPKDSRPRVGERVDSTKLSTAQKALLSRARSLIVPQLNFRGANLAESVDFLRRKSMEIEPETPPRERGINLVILPGSNPELAPLATLTLENTSFLDTALAVAHATKAELRVTDIALIFDLTDSPGGQPAPPVSPP